MKKTITFSAVLFSTLVLLLSCTKNAKDSFSRSEPAMPDRIINAKVAPGQTYTLTVANSGDVSIRKQAAHYLVSETGMDEKSGSLIYKYSPATGFTGIDEVLLSHKMEFTTSGSSIGSSSCNSNGDNRSVQVSSIVIKLTVKD